MKHIIFCVALVLGFQQTAYAQSANPPIVPVEKAPYHVPVFQNEYVTLLNVFIPPSRTSGYHRHALDSVGILLADAERTSQTIGTIGDKPTRAIRNNGMSRIDVLEFEFK